MESALVEQIDEQVLTEDEFLVRVDVIEDEIIEDYLEGALAAADKRAIETHFLIPLERQRKLRHARLLRHHLAALPLGTRETRMDDAPQQVFRARRLKFVPTTFRSYAEIAAALLVAVSFVYLFQERRELKGAVDEANKRLVSEGQQAMVQSPVRQESVDSSQPLTEVLNLMRPGLQRGNEELPAVRVGKATRVLQVEVALPSGHPGTYKVDLKKDGNSVWDREAVQGVHAPGGAIIKVEIPPEVLPAGTCELVLQSPGDAPRSYWFTVTTLR